MTEANLFQIEIPKRAPLCEKGSEALTSGIEYYSILTPNEDKGYIRHDFCLNCWEESEKDRFSQEAKTAWKAKVLDKKEIEETAVKSRDEKAISLLKEKLQNLQEEDWAETFVLALYLARRRILALRQELPQEDGSSLAVYEVLETEEMLPVKRKSLVGTDIELLQQKIATLLKK